MGSVSFTVNGQAVTADGEHTLVSVLREQLGLTGTVIGCGWDAARAAIAENLCRCAGYAAIVQAIIRGSRHTHGSDAPQDPG